MHSIIFANYPANETMGIGYTVDVAECNVRFLGNLTLNLWDCAGQEQFMKNYFTQESETIFKHVQVLIYVFDCKTDQRQVLNFPGYLGQRYLHIYSMQKDLSDYRKCIEKLAMHSPDSHIFILIHKMDMIADSEKEKVFKAFFREIESNTKGMAINKVFATSIWDESLYKAWSTIV